jgi:predicted nucleic acid-binding protein
MGFVVRLQGGTVARLSLFIDTSVWSLALRRDMPASSREVEVLIRAIESGETLLTTGLVLQELLQGFLGPRSRDQILDRFSSVPLLAPDRDDHVRAAELRNRCRRNRVQVGTIDALLAQLCIRHDLTMLTTDKDFNRIADHSTLKLWSQP